MPKLNLLFQLNFSSISFRLLALCLLLVWTSTGYGQTVNSPTSIKSALPEKLGEKWRSVDAIRMLSADQCAVLPDGDVYQEFLLEGLASRHYTDGQDTFAVEVFQMQFHSSAYGLFTFNRNKLAENRSEFFSGRYLVSLSSEKTNSVPQEFVQALKNHLASPSSELPPLPSHLPEENKLANSEIYLVGPAALARLEGFSDLKDVVSFSGGTEIAFAKYRNGNSDFGLIIAEYHTPQLASDGYALFQNYFGNLSEQAKAQRLLKRVGNYIVLTTNVQDLAAAENVISKIKYNPGVYWEGKKLSQIPLAFRPPDPFALEEMSQTAQVILRTFYWVGIMLFVAIILGFISGWIFFYWTRSRRNKLGYDDVYSDAGGSIRLNLDDYLLSPGDSDAAQNVGENSRNA